MTEILTRQTTTTLQLRDDGEGRTLFGPLIPWGVEARVLDRNRMVVETFERGALAGADPARVPLTALHPRDAAPSRSAGPSSWKSGPMRRGVPGT
jgi:hypothetical protein